MRKAGMCLVVAVALTLCGSVAWAGHPDSCDLADVLDRAMVLGLADQLGLDTAQTVEVLGGYNEYRTEVERLKSEQARLRDELMSGATSNVTYTLDTLMSIDAELAALPKEALAYLPAGWDANKKAQAYLFLSTLDDHVQAITKLVGGEKGAHAKHEKQEKEVVETVVETAVPEVAVVEPVAPEVAPEEGVKAAIQSWIDGTKAQDLDALMSAYSDDFTHYEYGDKAGIRDFMMQARDMGYLEGVEGSMEDAKVEVSGDKATIYPVELMGAFGAITFEYTLKKEEAGWKIISFDASGL